MLVKSPDGKLHLLDAKSPKGKPTALQLKLIAAGWPIKFVTTIEEALAIVGSREVLDRMREAGL